MTITTLILILLVTFGLAFLLDRAIGGRRARKSIRPNRMHCRATDCGAAAPENLERDEQTLYKLRPWGGIHAQHNGSSNLACDAIHINHCSARRWFVVRALRHWPWRHELRLLLVRAMPRYRVGDRWILSAQCVLSLRSGEGVAKTLSTRQLKSKASSRSARIRATARTVRRTDADQISGRAVTSSPHYLVSGFLSPDVFCVA